MTENSPQKGHTQFGSVGEEKVRKRRRRYKSWHGIFTALTAVSVGMLATCGSWASLESFCCLASESGFFQPCLVFLGPFKGQLRENMN